MVSEAERRSKRLRMAVLGAAVAVLGASGAAFAIWRLRL
jgi:hypothetical protein